jgi:hypothetical protein
MHTALFIFYSLVCGFAICRLAFIRNSGIRPAVLLALFAAHVLAGLAHNFIAYRYFPGHGDIWDYFWKSFQYRHRLLSDLDAFLADNSTWTYVSHNGLIYVQMILNLFSFDHMDIDTLLFAFPVFLGNIALFRTFRERFPDDPLTGLSVFLLPSLLFWTACVYREGILYMLLGFLLLGLHRILTKGVDSGRSIRCAVCFLLIVYFRSGFAFTLLPAIFAWCWLERPKARTFLAWIAALAGAAIGLTVFFVNIPRALASWQNEFYELQGHSRLVLPALDGSWSSLFHTLPAAAFNGFLEPLPGTGGQPIYLAFSIELLTIWVIVLLSVLQIIRSRATASRSRSAILPQAPPFAIFCILFSLTGMFLIGLFVPFAGTIVRYRSIYLLFLLAPFLHSLGTMRALRSVNLWLSRHMLYK